ncbi:hypothetical protein ACTXGQ_00200 [Marinobacter sp. 1Y8]
MAVNNGKVSPQECHQGTMGFVIEVAQDAIDPGNRYAFCGLLLDKQVSVAALK